MEFHGKKIIENSPLAIHKPPPIPEISRLLLPVNLLPNPRASSKPRQNHRNRPDTQEQPEHPRARDSAELYGCRSTLWIDMFRFAIAAHREIISDQ